MNAGANIDWLEVALGFVAGLALFLYGVDVLAKALKQASGGTFERLLRKSGENRLGGLAAGTVATVALDSSSVTINMLVAIIDAGLIGFAAALPMILGANIGTTISSQVFAWNVDQFAPVLLAIGLLWRVIAKAETGKSAGTAVFGIGLVLFGRWTIGEAASPLQGSPDIVGWLERLEDPLLGMLAGALVTVAIQSSSATLGIVIALAGGGLITLPAGLAIMVGAEIGTCADTLIATIGRSRAAVKAGLFHLSFNLASALAGLLLIGWLADFARWSASDTGQQVANAHVLFNVAGALLMLPFVKLAARGLDRIVPDRDATPHPSSVAPAQAGAAS